MRSPDEALREECPRRASGAELRSHWGRLLLALLAATAGTDAWSQRGPAETRFGGDEVVLPMLLRGAVPAVEVHVNGQGPFLFSIDTGALGLVRLDAHTAKRLGLESLGQIGDGSGGLLELIDVESLRLGGLEFRGVPALMTAEEMAPGLVPVDGVLAYDLFEKVLLTLDFPGRNVRLDVGQLDLSERGIVGLRHERRGPAVNLYVNDRQALARIETAARGGFLLPAEVLRGQGLISEARRVGLAQVGGERVAILSGELAGVIRIGSLLFEQPTVTFSEAFLTPVIGPRALKGLELTFDQRSGLLRLRSVDSGAAAVGAEATPQR